MQARHWVYKYVLDGQTVYVGKCDKPDVGSRIKMHGRPGDNIPSYAWADLNRAQIYVFPCVNSTMSDVIESELIRREKPKYNNCYKTEVVWGGLAFPELAWEKYDPAAKAPKSVKSKEQQIREDAPKIERFVQKVLRARDRTVMAANTMCLIHKMVAATTTDAKDGRYPIREQDFFNLATLAEKSIHDRPAILMATLNACRVDVETLNDGVFYNPSSFHVFQRGEQYWWVIVDMPALAKEVREVNCLVRAQRSYLDRIRRAQTMAAAKKVPFPCEKCHDTQCRYSML